MKLWKNSERQINGSGFRKAIKECGGTVKKIGEYNKWGNLQNGGRIQLQIDVYEMVCYDRKMYLLCDALDRAACEVQMDKKEVFDYLKDHGWKTPKKWYIEDCGMTEETWNIWNGQEEGEE